MKNWGRILFWVVVAVAGAACVGWSYHVRYAAEGRLFTEASFAREEAARIQEEMVLFTEKVVPAGRPFAAILQGLGIAPGTAAQLSASAQPVFDLRHLRAGNRLAVGRSVFGDLRAVRYRIDTDRVLYIAPKGNDFHSEIQTIPSETAPTGVVGEIHGSLFEGIINAGEKPDLAMRLADIFGWDLDFYTDPRPGDTFRVVVEKKKLSNGEFGGYGKILAAEYVNGGRPYRAVLFHDPAGNPAYYTPEGKSLKKAFLHSPLKFAAPITSHFSEHRFHPILKEYRPHLGIDYGAPSWHSCADNRRRPRDFCRAQRRLGKSSGDPAFQRLHHVLHAPLENSGAQRRTRRAGPAHRACGNDGACHRAASRFPDSAPRGIFEFRTAPAAAFRARRKK